MSRKHYTPEQIIGMLREAEVSLSQGQTVKIGRGLDFYQRPDSWYSVGTNDFSLRPCLETKVDIFKV